MNLFWDYISDGGNWGGQDGITNRLLEHIGFTVVALLVAGLIALPLGMVIGHTRRGADLVILLGGAGRTLPAIGVLIWIVHKTDAGNASVTFALILIAIPPMLTAAYAGVRGVDRRVVGAARGLGMQPHQVLLQVEVPVAVPAIVAGVRSAALQVIATATIAAYVAAGGLGRLVVDGLADSSYGAMATGAVLLAVLAVVVDLSLAAAGRAVVSPGISGHYPARAPVVTKSDLGTAEPPEPETEPGHQRELPGACAGRDQERPRHRRPAGAGDRARAPACGRARLARMSGQSRPRWSPAWPPRESASFDAMWAALAEVGRSAATGGYRRLAWTPAELECRDWFRQEATARGLDVQLDRNGNLWAWDGATRPGLAVVTGSHLDSVPDGGAFDGPLGLVSAFAALDALRSQGWEPARPLAVVAFVEEEGSRFGVACAGSRLLTGVLDPDRARGLRDADGVTLAEAMRSAGADPGGLGCDEALLTRIGCFVELHVEQGRGLAELGEDAPRAAVAVGTGIWPHGRWRLDFRGAADHAGTTVLSDRRDPMLALAEAVLLAREHAALTGARATIGRVRVSPNGTNAIAAEVSAWLDARAPAEALARGVVDAVTRGARRRAAREGVTVELTEESWSPAVDFDVGLVARLALLGRGDAGDAPLLPTGAGHDAGVLAAAGIPTAMLFVRNPTGVSHSPAEHAEHADCLAGVAALAGVLADLAGSPHG